METSKQSNDLPKTRRLGRFDHEILRMLNVSDVLSAQETIRNRFDEDVKLTFHKYLFGGLAFGLPNVESLPMRVRKRRLKILVEKIQRGQSAAVKWSELSTRKMPDVGSLALCYVARDNPSPFKGLPRGRSIVEEVLTRQIPLVRENEIGEQAGGFDREHLDALAGITYHHILLAYLADNNPSVVNNAAYKIKKIIRETSGRKSRFNPTELKLILGEWLRAYLAFMASIPYSWRY